MDDAGVERLRQAIRDLHGVDSNHVETVAVHERYQGETVWKGDVEVFDLVDHTKATRAYAWSFATTGTKRQFFAVLHVPPVDSPVQAVRAAIVAERRRERS